MNKNKYILLVTLVLLSSLSMTCVTIDDPVPAENDSATVTAPEHSNRTEPKVEIVLFHGTRRCTGCINVGKWTEEVLHTYYEDELADGTVMFQEINMQTNPKMVAEYGVKFVSL